jgi:hypothetical protein
MISIIKQIFLFTRKNLLFIFSFSFSNASSDNDSIEDKHPLVRSWSWVCTERNQGENYQYSLIYVFITNLAGEVKLFKIHDQDISKNSFNFTWSADENQVAVSMSSKDNDFVSTAGYIISYNKLMFSNDFQIYIRNQYQKFWSKQKNKNFEFLN